MQITGYNYNGNEITLQLDKDERISNDTVLFQKLSKLIKGTTVGHPEHDGINHTGKDIYLRWRDHSRYIYDAVDRDASKYLNFHRTITFAVAVP